MSFVSSGKNKGKKFRLENKVEEWLASTVGYAPNQQVLGYFIMENRNSESEVEEKNNDEPDNDEGTSPGEETNDGDNSCKNKLDIPVEYRSCTCEQKDKSTSKNERCRFCDFDLAHVKLPSHTWTFHGVPDSVESSSNSHPSTSAQSTMSFISSGKNRGNKFRLENKVEEWLAYDPNQRVFGFFVTEDRNSESEGEEKNNDEPDNYEGTSPGEETNGDDNFSKNKLDIPVEYRTCTYEHRDKPKSKYGRCRFCGFDLAHVKLPSHTWTFHGVPDSVESSSNSHPSTSEKSSKQNRQQRNENKRKKRKREANEGNLKTGCWECELCSRKFTHVFRLTKRYRNDHKITLRFSCGKCDKLFRYFNNYKSHLRGHSGVQTDRNRGSYDDKNKKEQSQSKQQNRELRFKCDKCHQRFSEHRELNEHMRTKHGLGQNIWVRIPLSKGPFGPFEKKK